MYKLVAICSVLALCFAQDKPGFGSLGDLFFGHHTGGTHTHESSEIGSMTFYYEPNAHYLVARTQSYCYVMSLNADQQQSVHLSRGLEDLELAMMAKISGGEDTLTSEDLIRHGYTLDRMCSRHTLYKVGDVETKTTTAASMPIG